MNRQPTSDGAGDDVELIAHIFGELDAERGAAVEARLTSDTDFHRRYEELKRAIGGIDDAVRSPASSGQSLDAPERLSPERRSALLRALRTPANGTERKRSKGIDFGHPLFGLAAAACLIVALFWDNFSDRRPIRPNPLDTIMAPRKVFEEKKASVAESSSSKDGDAQSFKTESLERMIAPQDFRLSSPAPRLEQRESGRYVSHRNFEDTSSESAPVAPLNVEEIEFSDAADITFKLKASDTAISFAEPATPFVDAHGEIPSSGPLFAAAPPPSVGDEEEVFELSPFEVTADDNQGYRAVDTLAGSRLSTEVVDRARYGFFSGGDFDISTNLADGAQTRAPTTPGRKNLKVLFSEPAETTIADKPAAITYAAEAFELDLTEGLAVAPVTARSDEFAKEERDLPQQAEPVRARKQTPPKGAPELAEYPEVLASEKPTSTFSLNVSDVSYRLAESSLHNNALPPAGSLRAEEFINAFDYGDAAPDIARKVGFVWEQAQWPFAHDRNALRFSIRVAASGRAAEEPLNVVFAIDASGSMARPDRIEITRSAIEALQARLSPRDRISLVTFHREARLALDGVTGASVDDIAAAAAIINPQGGTDIESGLQLAYETARRHFAEGAINRVILLTDGAANLGNTAAESLTATVEQNRELGIALDCFGIGFDGYDDAFLEALSRRGDGRYRFLRSADDAQIELGEKLAGILRPAAYDVKTQVHFNPERVELYQQIGYQLHQLNEEDFRDNAVDAAELGAAEAGNALYLIKVLPDGRGDLGEVRVRFRDASTGRYEELSWNLAYNANVPLLSEASPSLRLAAAAGAFAALLNESPIAHDIDYRALLELSAPLPESFPAQSRVRSLPDLIDRARRLTGQP